MGAELEERLFYVGLDLGKKRDYTALAVVERPETRHAWMETTMGDMQVRCLERVPLGTSYPAVVEAVRQLVTCEALRGQCVLVADATGVGGPVVDMLRAARLGCELTAVTMTGGVKENGTREGVAPAVSVPKRDLIAGVQVLLESGKLKIVRQLRESGTLVKELVSMRTQLHSNHAEGGAGGEHDDLVIALALAVWRAKRARLTNGWRGNRLI